MTLRAASALFPLALALMFCVPALPGHAANDTAAPTVAPAPAAPAAPAVPAAPAATAPAAPAAPAAATAPAAPAAPPETKALAEADHPGQCAAQAKKDEIKAADMETYIKKCLDEKKKAALPKGAPPAKTAAAPGDGRYSKDPQGVITDKQTGLQWFPGPNRKADWYEAGSWAHGLTVAGGGWRMPTRSELAGLREEYMENCFHNKIFDIYGLTGKYGRYCPWVWSGEPRDPSTAWGFTFRSGKEDSAARGPSFPYGRAFAVRAVSEAGPPKTQENLKPEPPKPQPPQVQPAPTAAKVDGPRFSKDAQGVVTDNRTGLQWHISPDGDYTWDKAKFWVGSLGIGGGGWRLPTRAELAGLRVEKKSNCFLDPALPHSGKYKCPWVWTSEMSDASTAWYFSFERGMEDQGVLNSPKSSSGVVFAARAKK